MKRNFLNGKRGLEWRRKRKVTNNNATTTTTTTTTNVFWMCVCGWTGGRDGCLFLRRKRVCVGLCVYGKSVGSTIYGCMCKVVWKATKKNGSPECRIITQRENRDEQRSATVEKQLARTNDVIEWLYGVCSVRRRVHTHRHELKLKERERDVERSGVTPSTALFVYTYYYYKHRCIPR